MSSQNWLAGIWIVAASALLVACSSSPKHDNDSADAGSASSGGSTAAAEKYGLDLAWERENFGGATIDQMFHDADLIYTVTSDNAIHAIGANGVHRWISYDMDSRVTAPPAANSWAVAFLAGSDVYVFDRAAGNLLMKRRLPFPPSSVPAISESTLFVPTFVDNRVNTVDLETGRLGWSYRTAEGVTAAPVVMGDDARQHVYLAGLDGEVTALAAVDATGFAPSGATWRTRANDTNTADLSTDGQHLYCASQDTKLYAFDPITGDIRWTFPAGARLEAAPVAVGDAVYLFVEGSLHAVDSQTGEHRWEFEHPVDPSSGFVAGAGDRLYVRDADGLHLVNAGTGSIERTFGVDSASAMPFGAGEILVVPQGGRLVAYRL